MTPVCSSFLLLPAGAAVFLPDYFAYKHPGLLKACVVAAFCLRVTTFSCTFFFLFVIVSDLQTLSYFPRLLFTYLYLSVSKKLLLPVSLLLTAISSCQNALTSLFVPINPTDLIKLVNR